MAIVFINLYKFLDLVKFSSLNINKKLQFLFLFPINLLFNL